MGRTVIRRPADARIGDPVVVAGVRYRIQSWVDPDRPIVANLAEAGPHWRTNRSSIQVVNSALAWDAIAGVWRVAG